MLKKTDLFTTVSPSASSIQQEPAKQDSTPKPEKRAYKKSGKKKLMPTQGDRYRVNKMLEENLTPKDENGLVSYLNDMSDEKIAGIIGTVSRDTVRHMRQEVFGTVRVKPQRKQNTEVNELEARITQLEELGEIWNKTRLMIIDHHTRMHKLEKMFNQLAEEIGFTSKV